MHVYISLGPFIDVVLFSEYGGQTHQADMCLTDSANQEERWVRVKTVREVDPDATERLRAAKRRSESVRRCKPLLYNNAECSHRHNCTMQCFAQFDATQ